MTRPARSRSSTPPTLPRPPWRRPSGAMPIGFPIPPRRWRPPICSGPSPSRSPDPSPSRRAPVQRNRDDEPIRRCEPQDVVDITIFPVTGLSTFSPVCMRYRAGSCCGLCARSLNRRMFSASARRRRLVHHLVGGLCGGFQPFVPVLLVALGVLEIGRPFDAPHKDGVYHAAQRPHRPHEI